MVEVKDSPFPPEFFIEIGGKRRRLSYPLPSIFAFEDVSGLDIINRDPKSDNVSKINSVRKRLARAIDLLWAGLIAEDETLTRKQVANWVTFKNLDEVDAKTGEAFAAYLPEVKSEPDAPADPQKGTADPQS